MSDTQTEHLNTVIEEWPGANPNWHKHSTKTVEFQSLPRPITLMDRVKPATNIEALFESRLSTRQRIRLALAVAFDDSIRQKGVIYLDSYDVSKPIKRYRKRLYQSLRNAPQYLRKLVARLSRS